jgi:regulator of protease activity HflC (stomatin/prohibitin superfamily)
MGILKDIIDYFSKLFTWWVVVMPWQQGIRVTLGKKQTVLQGGTYLKIPIIHTVFVQEKRLRVISLPIQTVSTSNGAAITVSCSVGYSIIDIGKLYNTLYQPDTTIANIVASKVAEHVSTNDLSSVSPKTIEAAMIEAVNGTDWGLKYEYIRVINFASVKTFRLIQDQSWINEGIDIITAR